MQEKHRRAVGGQASAYPTLSRPASTCFSAPNDVLVPGFIVDVSVTLVVVYRRVSATARAAVRMTSVTACGCEIMITCEPSTSTMCAPAR